jgi:hypothetical protein
MPYTVWKNGEKIGETRFELSPGPRKFAGVFHPTASGLAVLPAITAMAPALFDFGRLCRARGIKVDESRPEAADQALELFANTPEGKRVQAAASHVADLELRDTAGRTLPWESILITDRSRLAELAGRRHEAAVQLERLPGDPIRFMISTTLIDPNEDRPSGPLTMAEPLEIC